MHPVSPAGALVGRESEMALLTGLIKEVARGHGGSVLIEGEPGIGKSALVRAAVAEAIRSTAAFAAVAPLVLNEAEWAFTRKQCERDVVSCLPVVQCPISDICPSAGLPSVRMFTEPESLHGYY